MQNKNNSIALINAAFKDDTATIKLLLKTEPDIDVDAQDSFEHTALMVAAAHGCAEIVQLLLEAGADPNIQGKFGDTAMMEALMNARGFDVDEHELNCNKIIPLLLAAKADPNIPDSNNLTPLMSAAGRGYNEIVRLLLAAGATTTINTQNRLTQSTALMYAAWNGRENVVRLLLEAGADINKYDRDLYTALQFAALNGHKATANLLREAKDKAEAKK